MQGCSDKHIMSQVTELGKGIYIGPFPKLKDDIYYLSYKLGISCIVNLLPVKPEETWGDGVLRKVVLKSETYTQYMDEKFLKFIHLEFDMEALGIVDGQKIVDKQANEARNYIKFCEKIKKQLEEKGCGAKKIFIHYQTGFKEEAIVGFMLLKSLYPDAAPKDPCQWLSDNEYNVILSDSGETRSLMIRIYKEMDKLSQGLTKYFFKKVK